MSGQITGASIVAGVAGAPVRHSLSPIIHNAWLKGAGIDGVYVALPVPRDGMAALIAGFRGGVVRGLNVTLPFKEEALAAADRASARAQLAGAANVLVFQVDGSVTADNTDGAGMLAAFAEQSKGYDLKARPVVILGAGGAARGAAAALTAHGLKDIRIVNRTLERALEIRNQLGDAIQVVSWGGLPEALAGAGCVINATSLGLEGQSPLAIPLTDLQTGAVVMDMVYRPLKTAFLARAEAEGFATVDGLAMLIGQAIPSFEVFFGAPPPADVDVRALCIAALNVA